MTPWTVAHQAPQSMEFSRQEYWSGLPFPSPGDLPDPGIKPGSPALQADALPSEPQIWSIKSLQGECLLLFNLLHACQVTTVMSDSLQPLGLWLARLLCPWNSPGKSTGVGCPFLLQGIFSIFPNLGLLHCRWILYRLSHQGSQ